MPRKFKRRQILQASLAVTVNIGAYNLSPFGKGSTEHVEAVVIGSGFSWGGKNLDRQCRPIFYAGQ